MGKCLLLFSYTAVLSSKEPMSTIEIVCAIFAIGMLSGLRALSPIAVLCWLALLHRLAAHWLGHFCWQ